MKAGVTVQESVSRNIQHKPWEAKACERPLKAAASATAGTVTRAAGGRFYGDRIEDFKAWAWLRQETGGLTAQEEIVSLGFSAEE